MPHMGPGPDGMDQGDMGPGPGPGDMDHGDMGTPPDGMDH
jgi:hypothetical protein